MHRLCLILIYTLLFSQSHQTTFERSAGLETCHPENVLAYYQSLSKSFPSVKINKVGEGDSGKPIYTVIVSSDGISSAEHLNNRAVVFINNGIHSGEACGIDASQMLARDLAKKMQNGEYKNIVAVIVPVFNVGGHTNFSPYNRVNQNGPVNMGFRANAKNYNLNRDFLKAETQNMRAFYTAYHTWKPHVFIDNHSTNGADYQYNLTYLINETDDVTPSLKTYITTQFQPFIERSMEEKNDPISPYVNLRERDNIYGGINYFYASGRYSTGYASFFNAISILVETHMLKPYKLRVNSNLEFMWSVLEKTQKDYKTIILTKQNADNEIKDQKTFGISWKLNDTKKQMISFLGYEFTQAYDKYSNKDWVKYNPTKPKTYTIPYYKTFAPQKVISTPKAYIIPHAWKELIPLLRANGVTVQKVSHANLHEKHLDIEEYVFSDVTWKNMPWEGHFLPEKVEYTTRKKTITAKPNDFIVFLNQPANKYLIETLEPYATDSFFRWGKFNTIFTQIEYFSPYLFVDKVEQIFKEDPKLKQAFNQKVKTDKAFASNPYERLNFIYKGSKYFEKSYKVYPIKRVINL